MSWQCLLVAACALCLIDNWTITIDAREICRDFDDTLESNGSGEYCKGYLCSFAQICGRAPLNPIRSSGRSRSQHNVSLHRIINGAPQKYGEWPSFANLAGCGGVLISDRHILTAAHCASPNWTTYTVTLGEDSKWQVDAHELMPETKSTCFPKKFPNLGEHEEVAPYDYAVIELAERVHFNDYIQPACWPEPGEHAKSAYDLATCYHIGMGVNEVITSDTPKTSNQVQKIAQRPVDCPKFYNLHADDPSRECWTDPEARGQPCVGDSGGPILCLHRKRQRWTVLGITSYGPGDVCAGMSEAGHAAVFTSITKMSTEIKQECNI